MRIVRTVQSVALAVIGAAFPEPLPAVACLIGLTATLPVSACGHSAPPTAPAPPPEPRFLRLEISGSRSLSAIGETIQLTALGIYSGGSSRPLSSGIEWSSPNATVATVSSSGLVTATGFGAATVTAAAPEFRTTQSVRVTVLSPGTFIVAGHVREPGQGPLRDVRVSDSVSGLSTLTDGSGKYALPGVRGLQLLFEKSAYESKVFQANPDTEDEDVPMQSIVRVGVGETGSTLLAPNDLTYTVAPGINCSPCRMIRVVAPRPGPLEVRLKWGDSRARMELWIEGRRFQPDPAAGLEAVAELTVPAGELLVYVSSTKLSFGTHVPISISVVAK